MEPSDHCSYRNPVTSYKISRYRTYWCSIYLNIMFKTLSLAGKTCNFILKIRRQKGLGYINNHDQVHNRTRSQDYCHVFVSHFLVNTLFVVSVLEMRELNLNSKYRGNTNVLYSHYFTCNNVNFIHLQIH